MLIDDLGTYIFMYYQKKERAGYKYSFLPL